MKRSKILSKKSNNNNTIKEKANSINLDLYNLTDEEKEIISNTVLLKSKTLRDIMVPRVDVVMVNVDTQYDKIIKAFNKKGNSRIPVYKDSIDNIVGVLYVKDLIEVDPKNFSLKKCLHKPYFVPISMSVMDLLKNFREKQVHIAMVVDEYGGFSGIVSMEDALEELIGDIKDEFDDEENAIKENEDGTILVDARLRIEDFNKQTKLTILPDKDADTVGGFLFSYIGRLPKRNEAIVYKNYKFTVVGKSGNIVTKIRLEKNDNSSNKENNKEVNNTTTDSMASNPDI